MRASVWLLVALFSSGCLGVEGQEAGTTQDDPGSSGTVRVTTPIALSGTTWTVACVRVTPLVQCRTVLQGSAIVEALDFPGSPVAMRGTLAWDSQTPLTDELALGVVAREDGEWGAMVPGAFAVGTSPLALDLDLTPAPTDELGVHIIYYSMVGTEQTNVHFSVRQDWDLTGEIVSTVEDPAAT